MTMPTRVCLLNLLQRLSIIVQRGNTASVMGTIDSSSGSTFFHKLLCLYFCFLFLFFFNEISYFIMYLIDLLCLCFPVSFVL